MGQIEINSLTKQFGDFTAVDNLTLDIADKSFVALLGPSGCGKSTTMNMIAGIEAPNSGSIRFDGKDILPVPANKRGIGFVFQNYAIFTHMTVYENLAFALRVRGIRGAELKRSVTEAAELMRLTERLQSPSTQLSVNEMQKLAIGRAAIAEPAIFLLDEPLSNVDAAFRAFMRTELKHIQHRLSQTMVYVTHDQVEAMSLADKIAVIDQGVLQQFGTPEQVYNEPANLFVANFIGSPGMNLVPAKVVETSGQLALDFGAGGQIEISPEASMARSLKTCGLTEVVFGIRPENARIVEPDDPSPALNLTLALTESIGARATLHFDLGDAGFKLVENKRFAAPSGTPLRIALPEEAMIAFDPVSGNVIRREG